METASQQQASDVTELRWRENILHRRLCQLQSGITVPRPLSRRLERERMKINASSREHIAGTDFLPDKILSSLFQRKERTLIEPVSEKAHQ